jgi:nucleotide-binding universal stress UspA family protein
MGYVMPVDAARPGDALTTAMKATIVAAGAPTPGGQAPPAVTITVSVVCGDPATELQRSVEDGDLQVVGSRGRGAAVGPLLGSVSQYLAAHAPCSVVVVPDLAHSEEGAPA